MIEIKKLSKKYGNFDALKEVSFEVKKGEILGLLGPNGAGKTTTMKICMGFLNATSGVVEIQGLNIEEHSQSIQNKIGYLPENTPLYADLNVYEHLEFVASSHNMAKEDIPQSIAKTARMCGLEDRLYFNVSELSKGYKQRLGLAQALIHNPEILILDEPSTGLDPNQIVEIRKLIKDISKEKTIILSTHIMQEVEALCDRVIVLNKGKLIASGSPKELSEGGETASYKLSITIKGTKKNIEGALNTISSLNIIQAESVEKGVYQYIVELEDDQRGHITEAIIKAKLVLLEMTTASHSLESAFQKLTQ